MRVCTIDDLRTLSPHDFDSHAVVAVATIQTFRVEDTGQRNAYAFDETLEPHFRSRSASELARALEPVRDAIVTAEEAARPGRELLAAFVGQPRFSLANWIALRKPFVIVDEAHNTKTERSFEALARLNPALILELTATPVPKRTNVLYHVSAQQLQAEHMIKLPIRLLEHTRGWQKTVLAAVHTQRRLEGEAQNEQAANGAYIRPIDDGRLLLVEYKGGHIEGMAKEVEKRQVGELWAKASGGRCVFVSITKQATTMTAQIDAAIGSPTNA